MSRQGLSRVDGRRLFGHDPAAYASGRPGYPTAVFDALSERCNLGPGVPTLEIGPGAGQATAELLARGASPLIAVEPNARLAAFLAERFGGEIEVVGLPFEEVELEPASIRLAVAATSWHWVDQTEGLARIVRALAPGGWWAVWWTQHHDPDHPDALYDALNPLLEPLQSYAPPGLDGSGSVTDFRFDREGRLEDLRATGSFENLAVEEFRWSLELDPSRARALFATFSPILALPEGERERVLDEIARIVRDELGGRVERRCVTILYTARRNGA